MNWENGYSAEFYACFVDKDAWIDEGRFEIIDGSVDKSDDSIRENASLTCTDYNESSERWIRIYMDAVQGGNVTHNALFTGLATSPTKDIDGALTEHSVECYSVLKPCEDVLLQRGWYVPSGRNGALAIRDLLDVTPAPVYIDGDSPSIADAIIAEDDETNLTMIEKILNAIDWRLQITGEGRIVLSPKSNEIIEEFSPENMDIIETSLSIDNDWFDCPNVFRATLNEMSAVARDDSADSPLSTVSRGREIWEQNEADLANDETLAEYASRMLRDAQNVSETAKYTRRYHPDVNVGDLVRIDYPQLQGTFRVKSQSIGLTYNGETSEEVERG